MSRKYWLTTDTHFGHDKMGEYCGRPDNFEEIVFKGLEVVGENDILIHLGDICIGDDEGWHDEMLSRVSGKWWLVRGNHDRKSLNWYLEHGWDFVADSFVLNHFGKKILFSHTPLKAEKYDVNIHGHFHNALPRLRRGEWKVDGEKERNEQDLLNLLTGKHGLLALEYTNYKPVLLQRFIQD